MTSAVGDSASYHVLLVGIDDYTARPLRGCVNDIDAVQALLIDKVKVPPERILRLASPRRKPPAAGTAAAAGPVPGPPGAVPEQPATLANIRSAFTEIAQRAKQGDRVFIYYSGHGARAEFARQGRPTFFRESLVPADFDATPERRLLCDHELNHLLRQIAVRTASLTFVLDCCHSGGATRDMGMTARTCDLGLAVPLTDTDIYIEPTSDTTTRRGDGLAWAVDHCHVVTACLDHELAQESDNGAGVAHGLLTSAFVSALGAVDPAELTSVPWSQIWQDMRASVETRNPWQHLGMRGNAARAVLAGPPVDGDPGIPVRGTGDVYELGAGSLTCVTPGAVVAVYGEQPVDFPPLGSAADHQARHGLLRVTSATLSTATARWEGAPFELPRSPRGRLVAAGETARLRCAVVPDNAKVVQALRGSPLLEVVERRHAQVRLEQAGGRWLVTDDVHGLAPGSELFALSEHQLDRARDVLEHYFLYALPLRMAQSVGKAGMLQLTVLACATALSPAAAQDTDLPEARTVGRSVYDLAAGARVCFRVDNTSSERLRVTLLNSAASGKVQLLGDQIIDAQSSYVFWASSALGEPFAMAVPDGRQQCIDRLTAIGTTGLTTDVSYLRVDRRFSDVLPTTRGERDIGHAPGPPVEQWTATQAIVKTHVR